MNFEATNNSLTPSQLNNLVSFLEKEIPAFPKLEGRTISYDYEAAENIISLNWSKNYHISEDHGDYVLDFDADKNCIGIELLNFDISQFS